MSCSWGNRNNCCSNSNKCCNSGNKSNVDPCAEEKRRCYCEGYRAGCNDASCRRSNDDNCC